MQNEATRSVEHDIKVHLVNSFTRNNSGGNPAGVVLNPPDLSVAQKIAIARQVGFSETAFVYAGEDTDFKVDFFTPESEVDFCGHATLAVFFTLASLDLLAPGDYKQKTKAGILSVAVSPHSVVMGQALPIRRQGPAVEDIAAALGVHREVIEGTGFPIEVVSTGLPDILIPVQPGQLDTLRPDYEAIANLSREFDTIGFHVFELSRHASITAHCRNFAPLYGIDEESATGSASGALGCYLVSHVLPGETHFLLEQGRAMGCSSLIQVTIDTQAQTISRVRVGGQASMIGTKTVGL
ncbi:putative phenazine biosynthesis protein [Xenorhabdus mauleonii]|uniref:Phenazine biosynthesis protein n=1 Tax=Xenorhabdus mauleonii TaxID=351675 RepID=A0A1I3HWL9_9GAMM|nr:PhzF family phenazine biosynthesis protein [Xenorhabdus mauleonii]PHM40249.1 putative phenazine biosynthesis protein [Xenorhabdus mauleonii]SFI39970.1 phenazine biosynthesis protein PhzF family [Xenorhabdus mauleonii]